MKKLLGLLGIVLLLACPAWAMDLEWDYPSDWGNIVGYTWYFTDGTNNYNKTFFKADVTEDGMTVTYQNAEEKLNLQFFTEYSIYLVAYNDEGESDPSNTVTYTRSGYVPPPDVLPSPLPGASNSPGNLNVQ